MVKAGPEAIAMKRYNFRIPASAMRKSDLL
jgi:hypothetical protein